MRSEEGLEYELEKSYEVGGISVVSKVVRDWTDDALGTKHVIIESSCKSERWETRTQQYSLTTPKDHTQFADDLEKARRDAAGALARVEVMGDENVPPAKLLGIEIEHAGGKRLKAVASLTVASPYSLIQPGLISGLGLASTGRFHYELQGNALASVPIYTARIHFDDLAIDTLVVPSNHNGTIILGGDFLQQAFNLRSADLIQLLLPNHFQSLVSASRSKRSTVLIIGKYGENRERLEELKRLLASKGLTGIVLDEYPDIEEQDLTEKMLTFASISRFVLADDIAPSGHIQELKICQEMRFVTAVLRCKGHASTMMQADLTAELSYMKDFDYESDSNLAEVVGRAVDWANLAVRERSNRLNRLFSDWRSPERIMR